MPSNQELSGGRCASTAAWRKAHTEKQNSHSNISETTCWMMMNREGANGLLSDPCTGDERQRVGDISRLYCRAFRGSDGSGRKVLRHLGSREGTVVQRRVRCTAF